MRKGVLVAVLVLLCLCAFSGLAQAWVTKAVDRRVSGGKTGEWTSIAVDTSGAIHVSAYNADSSALQYSTNVSGPWVTEIVDAVGDVGHWTSIALDAYGKAHISYFDSTNYDLKYATNASGTWVATTVDAAGSVGWRNGPRFLDRGISGVFAVGMPCIRLPRAGW